MGAEVGTGNGGMMGVLLTVALFIAAGLAGFLLAISRLQPSRQLLIIAAVALSWVFGWIIREEPGFSVGIHMLDVAMRISAMFTVVMLSTFVLGWFFGWAVRGMRGNSLNDK